MEQNRDEGHAIGRQASRLQEFGYFSIAEVYDIMPTSSIYLSIFNSEGALKPSENMENNKSPAIDAAILADHILDQAEVCCRN